MGNYSFKTTGLPEPVNGVVEGHNFTQGAPHTAIYTGYSGLTFRKCNLCNCDVPSGSAIEDCLGPVHTSFCSNLHPKMLAIGVIQECSTNCSHVTSTDTVTIDGVTVDTNYNYADSKVT